ncbi:MAG: type II secretion system protein GspM [Gammaproteobacteria bacterium]
MNYLQHLHQWFMALEKRERWVLGGGAAILIIFIIYAGILSPYMRHRHALEAQVQDQRILLAWMQPTTRRIEALRGNQPAALPGGSLLSAVNTSVSGAGLGNALQQAQQAGDGSVHVQLSGADFDSLVRWLDSLHRIYGVVPSDVTVTRGAGPGLVDANLTLQGAAS